MDVEAMAGALAKSGCDLGDEREVIRTLVNAKFREGMVIVLMDRAIEVARVIRATNTQAAE